MFYQSIVRSVIAVAGLCALAGAQAASVSYLNSVAFAAAISNSGTDSFNDLTNPSLPGSSVTRNAGAYAYQAVDVNGLFGGDGFLSNVQKGSILLNSFGPDITAIGGNFFGSNLNGLFQSGETIQITVTEVDGNSCTMTLVNTQSDSFFGCVADSKILSMTFTELGVVPDGGDGFPGLWASLDNLILAQAAPVIIDPNPNSVPEPASLALFGLAVLAAGLASRRRKL